MNYTDIFSGIITGLTSSIIFNPLDKIIYISTTKNISIIDKSIRYNLFQGSINTISTRIITSGLYFAIIDKSNHSFSNIHLSILSTSLCSVTSPLQIIKFHSWYNNISMKNSYLFITKKYGIKGLFTGTPALFMRDFIFNYIYISNKKKDCHLHNLSIITLGLIISSPLNLIKNKKYGNFEDMKTIIKNFNYKQLGICKNIIRSSLCFYFNQFLYDNIKNYVY
jgi:hypothetical protein